MVDNKYHIIVVDDSMDENDPLVVGLNIDFGEEAEVTLFHEVDNAMAFVQSHISERMIIFMDCMFNSAWQGVDAIINLRKQTSLIYVVMMSANSPHQFLDKDITALINTDNIFLIKNTDTIGAKSYVNKIKSLWKSKFDCVLENWILKHPEYAEKIVYRDTTQVYTWKDLLKELRMQSPIGKIIEEMVYRYYIFQYSEDIQ